MTDFYFYCLEGIRHILDPQGLDHLLFIISFCLPYGLRGRKKELVGLITAFTVGHSISLILAAGGWVSVDTETVELLIPLSILLSCGGNFIFLTKRTDPGQRRQFIYPILLAFGLLHGLGFSNYLRAMLFSDESIVLPVLGFNVGIEAAQLVVVGMLLLLFKIFLPASDLRRRQVLGSLNGLLVFGVLWVVFG